MMKTLTTKVFCLLFFLTIAVCSGQNSPNEFWNKVSFGGGIGLGFGSGFFSATLAPSAIYNFNQYVSAGIGLNGTYASRKDFYNSTILGGSVLALFNPIQAIQLSAEFEELNVNRNFENDELYQDQNYWYPALFVGAGYRMNNVTVGLRYDLLYDESKSIYGNSWAPFVRVYF